MFFRVIVWLQYLRLCHPVGIPAGLGLGTCTASELCSFLIQQTRRMEKLLRSSCGGTRNIARAGRVVMEPDLESSSGRWLPVSFPSSSRQSGECCPLVYQMCPFPLVLLIPLLYISFLSFLHRLKFQNADLFQSWQEAILIHEEEFQVRPSLHNLFLIAH